MGTVVQERPNLDKMIISKVETHDARVVNMN